jgi:hypothetical protein
MGDSIRDTQSFISSNASASPAAAEPLRPCGQAVVTVITDRGETIKEAVRLIGRQKSVPQQSTNLEAQQSSAFEETHPIYLGTSTTGTFEHIPLGNWDFIVFSDQRVPTIIGDIPITTCEVPQPVTVTMPSIDENVVGPAWKLVEVVANPNNGSLSDDTPRLSTACTIGSSVLSIAHSRRSSNTTTVDVTFTFSFAPLPQVVGVGEVVAIPINLTVAGEHISENALATAGFLGFRDSLSVAACSLTACGGSPDAMPEQSGVANILFSGEPSDPSRILEFDAFLSDTTGVSSNCRTRYLYEFVPAQ